MCPCASVGWRVIHGFLCVGGKIRCVGDYTRVLVPVCVCVCVCVCWREIFREIAQVREWVGVTAREGDCKGDFYEWVGRFLWVSGEIFMGE